MGRGGDDGDSLTGLAKRWLKTQVRFHGNPQKAYRDRQEADALEAEMKDRAEEDLGRAVVGALMPASWKRKLGELEGHAEERKAEAARRRRADHEARPRATVDVALSGDVRAAFAREVPADVDWPAETGDALAVQLEPLEPFDIGGRPFQGLTFAVPAYRGPGTYDLAAMAEERSAADEWDPFWFQLWLDSTDEGFYWSPGSGPASVVVDPGERTLRVRMRMENAASERVEVDAAVGLPAAVPAPAGA